MLRGRLFQRRYDWRAMSNGQVQRRFHLFQRVSLDPSKIAAGKSISSSGLAMAALIHRGRTDSCGSHRRWDRKLTSLYERQPFTDRQEQVGYQCSCQHDIVDILMGSPIVVLMLGVSQPNSDDLLAQ
jgi:hypothetical protein